MCSRPVTDRTELTTVELENAIGDVYCNQCRRELWHVRTRAELDARKAAQDLLRVRDAIREAMQNHGEAENATIEGLLREVGEWWAERHGLVHVIPSMASVTWTTVDHLLVGKTPDDPMLMAVVRVPSGSSEHQVTVYRDGRAVANGRTQDQHTAQRFAEQELDRLAKTA